MNSMKTSRLIIALVAILGFVSCGKFPLVDSEWSANIYYTNGTTHHIVITQVNNRICRNLEILPGKWVNANDCASSYSGFKVDLSDDEIQSAFHSAIPRTITIVWDGEYSLTYDRDNHKDKLLVPELYTYLKSKSSNGFWCYGYTFTEEDYEYAKTNGVKLENSVE